MLTVAADDPDPPSVDKSLASIIVFVIGVDVNVSVVPDIV
jgi:hypothetical protein